MVLLLAILPSRPELVRFARLGLIGLVAFLVAGNATIFFLHRAARAHVGVDRVAQVEGISNLRIVDDMVWGGSHPSEEGYRALAAAGVTTVVDLRAEDDAHEHDALITSLGMTVVHLPTRDGQPPGADEVAAFLSIVAASPGTVFLHCGAGVGRTGSMASAYLVETGQVSPRGALGISLAVGPPSLEQLVYIRSLSTGDRPGKAIVAISRVLDAPRRIWSQLR
jgi:protein-tyrosine phosphatase